MYVCNCNGLTEKQVSIAFQNGAKSCSDVYAYYHCESKCGKCIPDVYQCLHGANKALTSVLRKPLHVRAHHVQDIGILGLKHPS